MERCLDQSITQHHNIKTKPKIQLKPKCKCFIEWKVEKWTYHTHLCYSTPMVCFCPLCNTTDAHHYWDCGSSCHPGLYLHAYIYRNSGACSKSRKRCVCVCVCVCTCKCVPVRLVGVFMRFLWVPSLALFPTLCVIHGPSVCFPITLHTLHYKHTCTQVLRTPNAHTVMQTVQKTQIYWQYGILKYRFAQTQKHILYTVLNKSSLTFWTLGQPTFLVPSLSEFSEAPGSTWIIVRVSAKVLTQVKLFVSGRLETEKSI